MHKEKPQVSRGKRKKGLTQRTRNQNIIRVEDNGEELSKCRENYC